jgi:hypothetical protein
MACRGATNTKGAYRAAMMGGGGGMKPRMIGEVKTEDKDEEGLDSTKGVICGLAMGDKTSGVQRCKMVGLKMNSVTKISDRVLTRLCWEKVFKVRV